MSRWDPDGRGRLMQAAFDLYAERGFDNTTVAEIAQRAGVTERTFFRHFADKREVLFAGTDALQEVLVRTVANAPASLRPIDTIAVSLDAAGAQIQEYRDTVRQRGAIIAANSDLRERELSKVAALSAALAATFRQRGLSQLAAHLTAEVTVAVFRTAFDRWLVDAADCELTTYIHEAFDQLQALIAGQ